MSGVVVKDKRFNDIKVNRKRTSNLGDVWLEKNSRGDVLLCIGTGNGVDKSIIKNKEDNK